MLFRVRLTAILTCALFAAVPSLHASAANAVIVPSGGVPISVKGFTFLPNDAAPIGFAFEFSLPGDKKNALNETKSQGLIVRVDGTQYIGNGCQTTGALVVRSPQASPSPDVTYNALFMCTTLTKASVTTLASASEAPIFAALVFPAARVPLKNPALPPLITAPVPKFFTHVASPAGQILFDYPADAASQKIVDQAIATHSGRLVLVLYGEDGTRPLLADTMNDWTMTKSGTRVTVQIMGFTPTYTFNPPPMSTPINDLPSWNRVRNVSPQYVP